MTVSFSPPPISSESQENESFPESLFGLKFKHSAVESTIYLAKQFDRICGEMEEFVEEKEEIAIYR